MAKSRKSGTSRGELAAGRELAFLVLCHLESYDADEREDAVAVFWRDPPGAPRGDAESGEDAEAMARPREWAQRPRARAFAERLLEQLLPRWEAIDAAIEETSRRWRVARMDRVDRNALRLAAIELEAFPNTPRGVILAESVRLASRYGSERSGRFVNGIAETLARSLRPEAR